MSRDPWKLWVFGRADGLVLQDVGFLTGSGSEKLVASYSTPIRGLQALVAPLDKRV